ncbi:MAG: aminotransferase class I/II-fold pyridoxal phosphate-dependent enzyme [Candidatus Gracilibacteria bacterium]|nr:aminotransferase class I/II-fold pyridoxal phosphate-dependent enzyme [Candidatus Gracilibacteria bacterium]
MPNPQATRLNDLLSQANPSLLELLSKRGKDIFWPAEGILKQSAEAKDTRYNATVGIATEDDRSAMTTPSLGKEFGNDPGLFPYAPSFGLQPLREKWQEQMLAKNPSLEAEKITLPVVTGGLTHGLSVAASLLMDPGETLILPDKFWGNYKLIFQHGFGAEFVPFSFLKPDVSKEDGAFDLEAFETTLVQTPGKKIVLLNTPNNPTGYSPTTGEATEIVEILKRSAEKEPLAVICDDAYWGLVYEEGIQRESLFSALASAHPNLLAVKIDGATKEEFSWGLRVGFVTVGNAAMNPLAADAIEQKLGGTVRSQVSNCSRPGQTAILKALNSPTYEREKQRNFDVLKTRAKRCREVLEQGAETFDPYFKPLPFNSGYFLCVELQEGLNAENVRQKLLKEFDTGVIATGNLLRIAFSSVAESEIETIFENISQACQALANTSGKPDERQNSLF